MTGHDPISEPEFQRGRLSAPARRNTARRFLLIAAGLSVLVHVLAALIILFMPHLFPAAPEQQQALGTVELLMVEKQGAVASPPAQSVNSKQSPPRPEKQAAKTMPEPQKTAEAAAPKPPASPQVPDDPAADLPPPTPPSDAKDTAKPDAKPAPKEAAKETPKEAPDNTPRETAEKAPQEAPKPTKDDVSTPPTPPAPPEQKAPVFDLAGTESESNATVMGSQVVPASQDDRYRNRPPIYPRDAMMRNEKGTVDLLIHVTAAGVTGGVDVLRSSGVSSLDRAAITAVLKWHFRPALQEGRAVPFDLPFRFEFEPF